MLVFFEGIVMCFILLMYCVVGIRNGAVGLVCLYEKDVQERVVELGLVTKEQIKKQFLVYFIDKILCSFESCFSRKAAFQKDHERIVHRGLCVGKNIGVLNVKNHLKTFLCEDENKEFLWLKCSHVEK